jgi:SAM-dependent methyltransferase
MTGLDFSGRAVAAARELAAATGADAAFVEADVYRAAEVLKPGSFDLVYVSVGALCWLPDVRRWAAVAAALLRPGGRLFIRDGHPVLQALDDERDDDLLVLRYPYFETPAPQVWDGTGTYVASDAVFSHTRTHEWSHGIGEIVTALLQAGLTVTGLTEHDSVPWDAMPRLMEPAGGGEWRLAAERSRLPCSFTVQAVK